MREPVVRLTNLIKKVMEGGVDSNRSGSKEPGLKSITLTLEGPQGNAEDLVIPWGSGRDGPMIRFEKHAEPAARGPGQKMALESFLDLLESLVDPDRKSHPIGSEAIIIPEKATSEGILVQSASLVWTAVASELSDDWSKAFQIPWRRWEELIAGAYKVAGFDEVTLTAGSGDHGRDVIAVKKGVGSIRILGSVKAYAPGHLITKEQVHALLGVVNIDPNASKGIFMTTSDFAPRILDDPRVAAAIPYRLELMNGEQLHNWLRGLLRLAGSE